MSNFFTYISLFSMVAAKEVETVKVGVESGTVKMLIAKLMGLLRGLREALRRKRGDGDGDDDAVRNL